AGWTSGRRPRLMAPTTSASPTSSRLRPTLRLRRVRCRRSESISRVRIHTRDRAEPTVAADRRPPARFSGSGRWGRLLSESFGHTRRSTVPKKAYYIDGYDCATLEGCYDEITRVMIPEHYGWRDIDTVNGRILG